MTFTSDQNPPGLDLFQITPTGTNLLRLTLQFSLANPSFTTCVTGSANPDRVSQWVDWSEQPMDETLLAEVLEILEPIHNWFYIEGRPENNDQPLVNA